MKLSPEYVAGLFDGEGCVQVKEGTSGRSSILCGLEISNSHRGVLEAVQATYGGRIYGTLRKPTASRVRCFRYRVLGEDADRMARDILPHSIIKKTQLALFIEARKLVRPHGGFRHPLSADEIAQRASFIVRVKAAKSEGIVAW